MRRVSRFGGKVGRDLMTLILYLLTFSALILPNYNGFVNHFFVARWLFGAFFATLLVAFLYFKMRGSYVSSQHSYSTSIAIVLTIILVISWSQFFLHDEPYLRGTFDNPTGLALTILLCTPFILRSNIIQKWEFVIIVILGISLAFTQCRCAMLWFCVYLIWHYRRRRSILIATLIFVVSLALIFVRKSDSTSGHWFIAQRTLELFAQSPWTGWGIHGFQREYMTRQADWFMQHPDSAYAILAGNIVHPYSDYLLVLVNYGLLGMAFVLGLVILIISLYKKSESLDSPFAQATYLLMGAAMFSYPSEYPFSWFVLAQGLIVALHRAGTLSYVYHSRFIAGIFIPVVSLIIISFCIIDVRRQMVWHDVYKKIQSETPSKSVERMSLIEYQWENDEFYLYHLAYSCLRAKEYIRCLSALKRRGLLVRDYYQEELLGELFLELKDDLEALHHFERASAMFPAKFYPRYQMFVLNRRMGNIDACRTIQRHVKEMPVKVPSEEADIYRRGILWDSIQIKN